MSQIENIHVIWLPGQACTGCTVSLLNASHPSLLDLLTGFIPQAAGVTLDYHATIMLPWRARPKDEEEFWLRWLAWIDEVDCGILK